MRSHTLQRLTVVAGVLLPLVLGPAVSAKTERDNLAVGKEGLVTLSSNTTVGGFRLKPGSYKVFCEHLESGDHHLVFTRMAKRLPYSTGSRRPTSDVTKVACTMEILPLTMSQTKVVLAVNESGERSVSRVFIQGENVSHEFPALTDLPLTAMVVPLDGPAEVHLRLGASHKVPSWK